MSSDELNFEAKEFHEMPRAKKISICRALAARARAVADLNPPEGRLQYVRIALDWDRLADMLEGEDNID